MNKLKIFRGKPRGMHPLRWFRQNEAYQIGKGATLPDHRFLIPTDENL
jgi:hypothetical protein